ncbi:ABC transporter permease [Paenibacillus harenae]|uniref:ABC-2 type transport system permease protein n=1 Tax=Paenibacillus harenae TaxID=306543 RepID=A0ABT9TZF2_PAEHA|nr:ABC transporter permease [Paenibacillus harenae]MDQ0112392.1 ABC-2 type transport system permease protein [Paenibacillus harenae]
MNGAKQFNKMFVAQLKMMFREKQVWFWNIFFPIILMVLFMIIFAGGGDDDFKATIAVSEPVQTAASEQLLGQLRQVPVLELKNEAPISKEQGLEWVKNEDVDALIILPESENASSLQLIVNTKNERSATTQVVSGVLDKFIQQANLAAAGAQPVFGMTVSSVTSGEVDLKYEDFLLTGMIGLSIAQGGLFGMVDLVDMRRRGLLKRLRMTPARMGLYGLSSMLVRLMLGIVQIVVLSLIGVYGFGASLHINIFSLAIAFFGGALVFNAMGYLFSSFSKTIEAYMGMANIASMLMMFLSGVFFPLESLPGWLQPVTQALPLTYFVDGMRDGLIYAESITNGAFWLGMSIMALWGVVSFLVGAQVYKTKSISEEAR